MKSQGDPAEDAKVNVMMCLGGMEKTTFDANERQPISTTSPIQNGARLMYLKILSTFATSVIREHIRA